MRAPTIVILWSLLNYCSLLCEKKRKQKDLHLRVTLNRHYLQPLVSL